MQVNPFIYFLPSLECRSILLTEQMADGWHINLTVAVERLPTTMDLEGRRSCWILLVVLGKLVSLAEYMWKCDVVNCTSKSSYSLQPSSYYLQPLVGCWWVVGCHAWMLKAINWIMENYGTFVKKGSLWKFMRQKCPFLLIFKRNLKTMIAGKAFVNIVLK